MIIYEDIHDILPKDTTMEDYCGSKGTYRKWEERIKPVLLSLGFEFVTDWRDGERDSFGPLSRIITLKRGGVVSHFMYG